MKKLFALLGLAAFMVACPGGGSSVNGTWRATETYQGLGNAYYRYQINSGSPLGGTVAACTDNTFATCNTPTNFTGTLNGNNGQWTYQLPGDVATTVNGTFNANNFSGTSSFSNQGQTVTGSITMTKQ